MIWWFLLGCASRSPACEDRVLFEVNIGVPWEERLLEVCPPTDFYVPETYYDDVNDALIASCVCYPGQRP